MNMHNIHTTTHTPFTLPPPATFTRSVRSLFLLALRRCCKLWHFPFSAARIESQMEVSHCQPALLHVHFCIQAGMQPLGKHTMDHS